MQITALVALLQVNALKPIPPATLERLRAEIVPAYVDARTNCYASTIRLQERQSELEKALQERIAKTPEVRRIDAAKQAFDAAPVVQAANLAKQEALVLAEMAAHIAPSVGELMIVRAGAEFEGQIRGLPETAELRDAVAAAQTLIDAETVHANLELHPRVREIEQAQCRLNEAEERMFAAAGIKRRGVACGGPNLGMG
jgi:hypothetical protein